MTETRRAVRRHPRATRRRSATPRPIRRSTSAVATPRTSSRSSSASASAPASTSPRSRPTASTSSSRSISRTPSKFGYVIKPLVIARDHGDGDRGARAPGAVPANWLLADVTGAKNAVYVQSYALGPSMYYGAGAGMLPTAMAVVSDIIEIGAQHLRARAGGARPRARARPRTRPLLPLGELRTRVLPALRRRRSARRARPADDDPRRARSLDRAGRAGRHAAATEPVSVVVLTHEAREGDVRAALAEIDRARRRARAARA